ncbi:MAG: hypothetical protein MJ252_06675 [archaeon]|nr:hypothetical protein [archaeon]
MNAEEKPNESPKDPITGIITAFIPEFNEKYVDNKVVTFYTIDVTNNINKKKWSIEKRYNDFEKLFKDLEKSFNDIPSIPKKTMFKISSYDELLKRRAVLQSFLNTCIERKDIFYSDTFKEFLEINKNSPEISFDSPPQIIGQLEDIPLGVRDFYYDKDNGVIFMCCSEMNIVTRTDSLLGNIKFPWEKENSSHVAVGCAIVYRAQKIGTEYKFQRGFAYSFPIQTGIVSWCPEGEVFSVGLDDGSIYLFKHEANSNFNNFTELAKIKPHKDRVMGIIYDHSEGNCYSCSTDKLFLVTNINKPDEESKTLLHSSAGFTNLYNDTKNKRMILTNEGGQIIFFKSNPFPPKHLFAIRTSKGGCIRGLEIDLEKELMLTASTNGNITSFYLSEPGKESEIKEDFNIPYKVKLRLVKYTKEKNELITGDENGRITVWNIKTGKILCKIYFNIYRLMECSS